MQINQYPNGLDAKIVEDASKLSLLNSIKSTSMGLIKLDKYLDSVKCVSESNISIEILNMILKSVGDGYQYDLNKSNTEIPLEDYFPDPRLKYNIHSDNGTDCRTLDLDDAYECYAYEATKYYTALTEFKFEYTNEYMRLIAIEHCKMIFSKSKLYYDFANSI